MTYKRELAEYLRLRAGLRTKENEVRAAIVAEINREVAPFLAPHAGYCDLVCQFFPEQRRAHTDVRHPRERTFKSTDPDFNSIIGFMAEGVIHEVCVGLMTYEYAELPIETLLALVPVAKRFARELRKYDAVKNTQAA